MATMTQPGARDVNVGINFKVLKGKTFQHHPMVMPKYYRSNAINMTGREIKTIFRALGLNRQTYGVPSSGHRCIDEKELPQFL